MINCTGIIAGDVVGDGSKSPVTCIDFIVLRLKSECIQAKCGMKNNIQSQGIFAGIFL